MADVQERNRMEKLAPVGNGTMDLGRQLDELIHYKQETLKALQHEVVAEQGILANAKREMEELKRTTKYQQEIDKEKFVKSLENEKEVLQAERRSLEQLDLEIEGRRKDVEVLEAKAAPIAEAMKRLQEERVAVELQRMRNHELTVENDHLANATSTMHEEVTQLKATLLKQQSEQNRRGAEQEQLQKRLDAQQKDVALQLENLSALKTMLDPKLSEVKRSEEQAERALRQAEVLRDGAMKQQAEMEKQKSDLSILSSQLQAKADALTEYDAALKRTEAEVRIKAQQAKLDVPMPEMPVVKAV